jgi:hypothetical protein
MEARSTSMNAVAVPPRGSLTRAAAVPVKIRAPAGLGHQRRGADPLSRPGRPQSIKLAVHMRSGNAHRYAGDDDAGKVTQGAAQPVRDMAV